MDVKKINVRGTEYDIVPTNVKQTLQECIDSSSSSDTIGVNVVKEINNNINDAKIKSNVGNGTTDSSGIITTNFLKSDIIILSVEVTNLNYIAIPFVNSSTEYWKIKVTDTNGTLVDSQAVEFTYYYIDKTATEELSYILTNEYDLLLTTNENGEKTVGHSLSDYTLLIFTLEEGEISCTPRFSVSAISKIFKDTNGQIYLKYSDEDGTIQNCNITYLTDNTVDISGYAGNKYVKIYGIKGVDNYATKDITDGLQNQVSELNAKVASVTIRIPNSGATSFDYPPGMTRSNIVLIGATIFTKYGVLVDYGYAEGNYYGDLIYTVDNISYTQKINGNAISITFLFMKYQ